MVEVKVSSATVATALTAFLMWVLQTYAFPETDVPTAVQGLLVVVVSTVVTFVAGYLAPHTPKSSAGSHRAE